VEELRILFANESMVAMGVANGQRYADPEPLPAPSIVPRWLYEKCLQKTDLRPGVRVQRIPDQMHPGFIKGNDLLPALRRYYRLPALSIGALSAKDIADIKVRRERTEEYREAGTLGPAVPKDGLVTRQMTRREGLLALWQACRHLEKVDGTVRAVRWRGEFRVEIVGREIEVVSLHGHEVVDD
jgi:hypothetical protein